LFGSVAPANRLAEIDTAMREMDQVTQQNASVAEEYSV
jgi:methyl-accepting chemotaxis protein